MEVRRLGADDDALLEQVASLESAVRRHDCPWFPPETVLSLRNDVLRGWDGEPDEYYVGLADGVVVARGSAYLPHWDNPRLAWLGVSVHPEHRLRGHGTQMLEHLVARATSEGRTTLGIDGWEDTPGPAWAQRRGFTPASRSIMRRHHLQRTPREQVRRAHDEAAEVASDYELVRVVGLTPDDLLPAVADLSGAINDAPLDDLALEDEEYPPERIRAYEEAQRDSGMCLHRLIARHRGTGELAGHTVVSVSGERPQLGWQHDTSVARAHRGHRLGLLLKAAMVLWLLDEHPDLEQVDTWNAESNDHMIAVNERLGYAWVARQVELQRLR